MCWCAWCERGFDTSRKYVYRGICSIKPRKARTLAPGSCETNLQQLHGGATAIEILAEGLFFGIKSCLPGLKQTSSAPAKSVNVNIRGGGGTDKSLLARGDKGVLDLPGRGERDRLFGVDLGILSAGSALRMFRA